MTIKWYYSSVLSNCTFITILDVLLEEGNLSRDRFAKLMCSFANSSRRDYDIGGTIKAHAH